METVIKRAIEGRWEPKFGEINWVVYNAIGGDSRTATRLPNDSVFLDPLFWQALGKAEGWVFCNCGGDEEGKCLYRGESWIYHWHRFIDHLTNGGKPDEFFEKLLTPLK